MQALWTAILVLTMLGTVPALYDISKAIRETKCASSIK